MNTIQTQLHCIAQALTNEASDTIIIVRDTRERFTVSPFSSFKQIQAIVLYFLGQVSTEVFTQAKSTVAYFAKVFGAKRVQRLNSTHEISTVSGIKRAFISIGEVTYRDFQELFEEIKSAAKCVRALSDAETIQLRKEFKDTQSVESCSTAQFQRLYDIINPFATTEDLFCGKVPQLSLPFHWISQEMRVQVYERMRRTPGAEGTWIMDMAKVLADLEMVEGTVLRTPKGNFCVVEKLIRGGGAFKYALRTLGEAACDEGHFLIYRGTRVLPTFTDWWKTILEDMRLKIGSQGIKATFDKTKALLQSDHFRGKKITAIGNSLGGVHAQCDALQHVIHKVITVASPGMADEDAKRISESHVKCVEHYVESEDIVDQLGTTHLGAYADPKKVAVAFHILHPGKKEISLGDVALLRQKISKPISDAMKKSAVAFLKAAKNLWDVMFTVHTRHTLLQPYSEILLTNQKDAQVLNDILLHTPLLTNRDWERARSAVPKLLSKL